ncbi:MAG: FAD binding domain-containing protein [Gemmatimonadaceae bacterium]
MIPAAFDYARARSLEEALVAAGTADTKVICGGQSLIPLLRFRQARPARLVDIGYLAELRGVTVSGGAVRIGAATTYRELLASRELRAAMPLVPEVAETIADLQVRNLGTIGGALVHADPYADMPAAMLALDATFHLQSSRGARTVAARQFFRGPFQTAMESGELLLAIEVPALPSGTGSAYATFTQLASGYVVVGAAAVVTRSAGRGIVGASLAFTGLAQTPFLSAAASSLTGTAGDEGAVHRAAFEAVQGVDAKVDIHAGAAYRLHLGEIAARRALLAAIARSM